MYYKRIRFVLGKVPKHLQFPVFPVKIAFFSIYAADEIFIAFVVISLTLPVLGCWHSAGLGLKPHIRSRVWSVTWPRSLRCYSCGLRPVPASCQKNRTQEKQKNNSMFHKLTPFSGVHLYRHICRRKCDTFRRFFENYNKLQRKAAPVSSLQSCCCTYMVFSPLNGSKTVVVDTRCCRSLPR